MLPDRHLEIDIRTGAADDERILYFKPHGFEWAGKLERVRATAETLLDAASPGESTGPRFEYAPAPPPRDDTGDQTDMEA